MRHLPLVLCALLTTAPAFARRPPRFYPSRPPTGPAMAAPAVAPPGSPGSPGSAVPQPAPGGLPPPAEPLRNQVRGRVRALVLERLTRELGLDPATAARIGAIYDSHGEREVPIRQQIRRSRRGLIAITRKGGPADDATINSLADAMLGGRAQLAAIDQERTVAVRRLLTPRQFAQFTLLVPLIKAEIHRDLLRVLRRGPSPAGGDATAPPALGDDDEDLE